LDRPDQSETDRESIRQRLGLSGRFIVAFSGSAQRWQMLERSARVFQLIKRLRPNAHFLGLCLDVAHMRSVLESSGIDQKDATVLSVPHAQVARHLAAADLGLLLRDCSIVNAVASPVKFAEYLASGVPVAISDGLGDYSSLVEQRQIGVVLPGDSAEDSLAGRLRDFLASYDRMNLAALCRRTALHELDLDKNVEKTIQTYGRLCLATCESCT
jgi:glycosyltransferase involved in cell wall biosynthesis